MKEWYEHIKEEGRRVSFYAVFGNPVGHSRSPQIHNALFQHYRIDSYYTRIQPRSEQDVIKLIRNWDIAGANITTPFKESVLPFLDKFDKSVETTGAVNTIVNKNGRLVGYNTDSYGITGLLSERNVTIKGVNILVIGAGGAGKAAVAGLIEAGGKVTMTNRTDAKAESFAKISGCRFLEYNSAIKEVDKFDIVVMAISPGEYPFDITILPSQLTLVDANYRGGSDHFKSSLVKCTFIRGERWLLHQAAAAFKIFTGIDPEIEIMDKVLTGGESFKPEVIEKIDINSKFFSGFADLFIDEN